METAAGVYVSPIGDVVVSVTERGVSAINFSDAPVSFGENSSVILGACLTQLREYFEGARMDFSIPLDLAGTQFQLGVWRALLQIPYGATLSYGEIAARIGRPGAARAVGGANHRNPISIIVPCHRVIGSGGDLTGYGGGLHRKRWLLDHEKKHCGGNAK